MSILDSLQPVADISFQFMMLFTVYSLRHPQHSVIDSIKYKLLC